MDLISDEFFMVTHDFNSLFDMFECLARISVLDETKRDSIMRVITLWADGQGILVPSCSLLVFLLLFVAKGEIYHGIIMPLINSDRLSVRIYRTVEFLLVLVVKTL